MKRIHMICKKVTRTVIPLILSCVFVFSSISPAKADTIQAHGTVSTSYGSYTWSAQQAASTIPITVSLPYIGLSFAYNSGTSFSIDYSLKNQYSGVVTITVTGNNTWSVDNVNIITSGCNLDGLPSDHASYKTSHTFHLRLKNSSNFSFVIYGAGATVFLGSTSVSVSHNMSVDNLEQQIDSTLDLYLPGMSTSLSGLGYDSDITTSLSEDTLAYDISIIKNYIDGIEGYLFTGNSYIDQIEGYLNKLNEYIQVRDSVDIPIYSRFAYLNLLRYGTLSDQYNYPYSTLQYGFFPTILTSNYSAPSYNSDYDVDVPAGKTLHFIYTISYWANIFDFIDSSSNSLNPTVNMIEGNNYYRSYDVSYTNNTSGRIFVNISMSRNVNRPVIPLYLGVTVPQDVAMLFNMDFENTYTRLLQQIADGIGNISQQQIIENNTNINNYNNYQTQINNVENNYYNEYNTYETNIENNNTFDFSGLDSTGVTAFNDVFTSMYNLPLVKWPVLITLLGLVIVIILG